MYTALKDIRAGQLVNLIGIVTMISEPSRTRSGGMYQFVSHNVAILPGRPQIGCVLSILSIQVIKALGGLK